MSLSILGGVAASALSTVQNPFAQRRSDFAALGQALKSGDLAGAQSAFAALQADRSGFANALQGASGGNAVPGASAASGSAATDPFSQLAAALASGDLAAAQSAFAALQAGHGHHHHHGGGSGVPAAAGASASTGTSAGGGSAGAGDSDNDGDGASGVGSLINAMA